MTHETESEVVESKLPCPSCTSSDAYAIYDDGHGYCFSCEGHVQEATAPVKREPRIKAAVTKLPIGEYAAIPDRKISEKTCKMYGVTVLKDDNGNITDHAYPFFNDEGAKCAVHIRTIEGKKFRFEGEIRDAQLFGQNLFKAGGKFITVTEGEIDAMSAYELTGSMWPCVSIKTGVASAYNNIKENYEYLNSFDNIVICMDNDAAGLKASNKIVKLFPGKAKSLTLQLGKDAGDYKVKGMSKEFTSEWWNAKVYTPASVLMGDALTKLALSKPVEGTPLCWDALNKITYGVRPHEIWTFGAGTGMGKTEIFKEFGYGLAKDHGKRSGYILLEEQPARTWQCITGKEIGKRYYLENIDATKEEIDAANTELKDHFVIYDHNGDSSFDSVRAKIQYMVRVLKCEYIFLDHITAMAEGKDEGNVNHRIHYMMDELTKMVLADPFTIFLISHLNQPSGTPHEEGGRVTLRNFYGSGAIKQRSHFVFGLEGNQQETGARKTLRHLRCLKDRNTGTATGEVIPLDYDLDAGRLLEYDIDDDNGFNTGETT